MMFELLPLPLFTHLLPWLTSPNCVRANKISKYSIIPLSFVLHKEETPKLTNTSTKEFLMSDKMLHLPQRSLYTLTCFIIAPWIKNLVVHDL